MSSFFKSKSSPEEMLLHMETHKLLLPSEYLEHARKVLTGSSSSSSSRLSATRRLTILEHSVMAALHMNQTSMAESYMNEIQTQVGSTSTRYRKLLAICLESSGEYEEALTIYHDLLQLNPSNIAVVKRIYCIHKAKGDRVQARICMNDYLERNGADAAAWIVLAQDCMEMGDFQGAAYAYEEAILVSPVDATVHCTLGELYVTIGTKETLILARKHFSMSMELSLASLSSEHQTHGLSIRALFGLLSVVQQFSSLRKGNGHQNKKRGGKHHGTIHLAEEMEEQEQEELFQAMHQYVVEKLNGLAVGEFGPFYGTLLRKILNATQEHDASK